MKNYFDASKQFDPTACSIFIANSPPKLAPNWPSSQPEISIFARYFLLWAVSCKIIWDLDAHVSIKWLWMKVTGLGMVPVDPDHAFSAQNPGQLGTTLGYLTAKSEALFTRFLRLSLIHI